jgi:DNA-binding Xre family transcriptional regulator
MKQTEVIEQILKDNNKNKSWLSDKMGIGQTAVSNMLRRGNVTVDTLFQICELFDYEITIQPKRRAGSRPNGQIVVEGKEREK